MSKESDRLADEAMMQIWKKWYEFYTEHFRAKDIGISYADQMAFYEIAQPLLRDLASHT